MSREHSLLTKFTCDLCGKYEERIQNIADGAEVPKPSFYDMPTRWIEIRRPNEDTLLYCPNCRQDIDDRIENPLPAVKEKPFLIGDYVRSKHRKGIRGCVTAFHSDGEHMAINTQELLCRIEDFELDNDEEQGEN